MASNENGEAALREAIAAERSELAELLAGLPEERWDEPTLCAGWRVRELVAHMTMPYRHSGPRVLLGLLRSRGDFNAFADRIARRDAVEVAVDELAASLAGNARHPWKPPGGGYVGALSHDVIHGLDFTVAFGIERKVPMDRLLPVLPRSLKDKGVRFFGVDLDGVELCADDADWSLGSGEPLRGAAQDLLLVLCGRRLPKGHLRGAQAERFTA
ncbi:MAG: maleylpyruvate isomerase family mycothiol-dependent enzyme [Streptosporangiales bacterium]|nr:maleylpyruvate isomerase family mycothiol-dependent enzyme [Streptosporangiales bacterium]